LQYLCYLSAISSLPNLLLYSPNNAEACN